MSKVDSNGHVLMKLWIQRTGDRSGKGTISGGTTYQEVTATDQEFFNGTKDRTNIPVQLQLRGVSVQKPPDTYMTTVWFTVIKL